MSYSNKIRNKIDSEAQERIHDCDKVSQMIATLLRLYKWCSSIRIKVVLIAKIIHPPRLMSPFLFLCFDVDCNVVSSSELYNVF